MFFDTFQDPNQPLLRNNQGIAIHQKEAILLLHMSSRKKDVAQNNLVIFDLEALIRIRSAKRAFVM
jgi:hypothetical protein